jgi:cytochrome d ubiquinol oxidase subunit II
MRLQSTREEDDWTARSNSSSSWSLRSAPSWVGADPDDRRRGFVFPGPAAMASSLVDVRQRRDGMPFAMTVVFFVASFLTLAVLFWPYMILHQVTAANVAPEKSLAFLFWAQGVFVLPVIVIYIEVIYWAIRGKLRHS